MDSLGYTEEYMNAVIDKHRKNPDFYWIQYGSVFERVQEIKAKTKRRAPKEDNGGKHLLSDYLYCADWVKSCGIIPIRSIKIFTISVVPIMRRITVVLAKAATISVRMQWNRS